MSKVCQYLDLCPKHSRNTHFYLATIILKIIRKYLLHARIVGVADVNVSHMI